MKKSNVDSTLIERIQKLRESEIDRPKLSLDDVRIEEDPKYNSFNVFNKETGEWMGNFTHRPARIEVPEAKSYVDVPEFITMDMPHLESKYRRRGIGEQMYKKIEQATGKKIIPDFDLSEYSAALHSKKGLGKSFGMSEYEGDFLKALTNRLKSLSIADPESTAKKAFSAMKEKIQSKGVPGFKSIAPLAGGVVGTALTAADAMAGSEEEGSKQEEETMQREQAVDKFKKAVGESAYSKLEEDMQKRNAAEKYLFKNLRDKIK